MPDSKTQPNMAQKITSLYKMTFGKPTEIYEKVDHESEESLIDGGPRRTRKAAQKTSKILLAFLTFGNIALFIASVYVRATTVSEPQGLNAALKATSLHSPVLETVEINTYPLMMNGTIWPSDPPSTGRQPPSAENDAAWSEVETILSFPITRADVLKLGKDPAKVAKFYDDYWGMGDDAYMATLDIQHQIHCVNSLRIAAFANHPGYKPSYKDDKGKPVENSGRDHWNHLGHCIDQLLQKLKCFGNTDVVTLAWMEDRGGMPWADFNLNHQCRDYDTIMKWLKNRAVDMDKFDKMPSPKPHKDAYIWPIPKFSELGHPLTKEHQETWEWKDVPDPKMVCLPEDIEEGEHLEHQGGHVADQESNHGEN